MSNKIHSQDNKSSANDIEELALSRGDGIDAVSENEFENQMALEKFMGEMVEVEVLPSANKNAERVVMLNVNGTVQCMIRGKKQTIKRKYLEVLARSRDINISTQEYQNMEGERATRIIRTGGDAYHYVVHNDTAQGRHWLQGIQSEAI